MGSSQDNRIEHTALQGLYLHLRKNIILCHSSAIHPLAKELITVTRFPSGSSISITIYIWVYLDTTNFSRSEVVKKNKKSGLQIRWLPTEGRNSPGSQQKDFHLYLTGCSNYIPSKVRIVLTIWNFSDLNC